ncbi:unnamed protein product [Porites lobata]|uniref:Uncharacterized protein n=1 Tax=Porites lobata TaxID=104759 RepID=A0ABN8Q105_9CNID|nr:unnamed protein product [Porites lobata]
MSGAVLTLQWDCESGHFGTWASSDVLTVRNNQKVYLLLSGNNFLKFSLLSEFLGLEIISETLFYRIQKLYCCPSIKRMWNDKRLSWAHCTICVLYTLMEESLKLLVDQEVVNCQEMGGKSANMQGAKKVSFTACHSGKLLLQRLKDVLKVDHSQMHHHLLYHSLHNLFFFTAEQNRELQEVIHYLDI